MKNFTSALIILLFILFILFLIIRFTSTLDAMTDIFESVVIPQQCYEYLITDGIAYYLLTTKRMFDSITNPRKFNTLVNANNYLLDNGCKPLPLLNLITNKNTEDPLDSYEKICSKEVALNQFNTDICSNYSNIEKNFDNYNIEECMIKKVGQEDPNLNNPYNPTDENLQKFINYFNQSNDIMSK